MMFFNKKDQEKEAIKDARAYEHNENVVGNQMPSNSEDEFYKAQSDIERSELIRWQQDLSEEAAAMGFEIMGFTYDSEEETWKRELDKEGNPIIEPLANLKFIRRIKPLLRLGSSRNFIMTNYSEERVRRTLQRASSKYTDLIYFHWKTFDINKKDCGYLVEMYQELIEPTVYRAWNNGERRYMTTIHKDISTRSINEGGEQKKKSLLGI